MTRYSGAQRKVAGRETFMKCYVPSVRNTSVLSTGFIRKYCTYIFKKYLQICRFLIKLFAYILLNHLDANLFLKEVYYFNFTNIFSSSCPEIDDETMAAKIEQLEAPRRQFREANKHLQEKVNN